MAISLRVVGIFYRTEVELPGGGTVKDVLDAAVSQITTGDSFRYTTTTSGGFSSPNIFRAFYEAPFTANSGIHYPPGEYLLGEDLTARPAYTVWQYYIFDQDGRFINRDKGFIPFDDPKRAFVDDKQSVVWRMVSVLAGPTSADAVGAPRLNKAFTS